MFIREKVIEFISRFRRKTGVSRSESFENGEKEKLLSLPDTGFEFGEWKKVKVHPDCHIQFQYNFYSVPDKSVASKPVNAIFASAPRCRATEKASLFT